MHCRHLNGYFYEGFHWEKIIVKYLVVAHGIFHFLKALFVIHPNTKRLLTPISKLTLYLFIYLIGVL